MCNDYTHNPLRTIYCKFSIRTAHWWRHVAIETCWSYRK